MILVSHSLGFGINKAIPLNCFCSVCFSRYIMSTFLFSSLPPSVSNSPTPSRHGSPRILLTHYPSNNIVFHGCITMASPYSPGFSPHRPYNSHLASVWVDSVSRGDVSADVSMLAFPDPASFLAGQLHRHLQHWKI